ncbi:MAG: tryptophan synthase subunit alpha [Verrucomicrobia bacterium]|nr:tryptophan synthase subunit alpha [Verrucomicrobiota bacterium]
MNRIDDTFARLKKEGRKGLIGYLTAGDPDMARSEQDIRDALDNGVDLLELGMPFSDPTADGPTIQEAVRRSLASGTTLTKVLDLVRRLRKDYETPIVLFGYANPLFTYGYARVCKDAAGAGVDGFLVVDLPYEESAELTQFMTPAGLHFVPLIAPTTGADRARSILAHAAGFVYYIMVTGVTGARHDMAADLREKLNALKSVCSLPIGVGFGLSSGDQAAMAGEFAEAVVVGSALVQAARQNRLAAFVRELRAGLDG